ncbi:MAG: hypothetical protein FI718_03515 [SAR202 cluster bacterium]|nr:hypothetical protein [SAR202 cluster bacterium]
MFDLNFINLLVKLLAVTIIGYCIGSIPICHLISKRRGLNIVEVGSRLAGSSNVTRNLGVLLGCAAFVGDFFKGILTISICFFIGLDGNLILLPLIASIAGHCKPIFARFKGGDGMALLAGSTLAIFEIYSVMAIIVALLIAFGTQKLKHVSSLVGFITGYLILAITSLTLNQHSLVFIIGYGGVAGLILAYAINGHRSRNSSAVTEWDNVENQMEPSRESRNL